MEYDNGNLWNIISFSHWNMFLYPLLSHTFPWIRLNVPSLRYLKINRFIFRTWCTFDTKMHIWHQEVISIIVCHCALIFGSHQHSIDAAPPAKYKKKIFITTEVILIPINYTISLLYIFLEAARPRPHFNIEISAFSPNFEKSQSSVIAVVNCWIVLKFKFVRHLHSNAAEPPVEFQCDPSILNINPETTKFHRFIDCRKGPAWQLWQGCRVRS